MGSTLKNFLLFIGAVIIGGGITYFSSQLVPSTIIDDQSRIIVGVVLVIFSFITLYFMTKGSDG